ncbi:MAG: alpha-amylase family protein [Chloroflexota bacterium]|nr:MAG: trehalose synthase [Chloroflexota bacterium]
MKRRDLWYKNAIIYCIDVETFQDSNNDGIGDFGGLLMRLEKIASLGYTCIWLLPFYPTPNRDNGYDITDYYAVDPRLGSLGDFVEFVHAARDYGIRVIIDLVVNHTSIEHPWFQDARSDPNSRYRNYYIWSKEKPPDAREGMVFPGVQNTTWTFDRKAQMYYFHRFYNHQADLNTANPEVRDEICKIMGFWLQLGVSGFRIDAAPFLVEMRKVQEPGVSDPYEYLTEFRRFLSWRKGDAVMLAEANVPMKDIPEYFGQGDRMHMLFHFMLNQHLFLALACGEAEPIKRALYMPPPIPETGQWAIFLRNHDEIDLSGLTDEERREVFAAFGPEPEMQIYNRGIRRRLAPMLGGDRRRLELMFSLLFTLPGTPVIWYGDEIGMGEDLSLDERNSVRTPMQWTTEQNAGFSTAPEDALIRPVVSEGPYRYKKINLVNETRDEDSLLNRVERLLRLRKECPEIGYGDWKILEVDQPEVLAHLCEWDGSMVLAVHNLADRPIELTINLENEQIDHLLDLIGDEVRPPSENGSYELDLEAYEYRWLRCIMKPDYAEEASPLPAEARFPQTRYPE